MQFCRRFVLGIVFCFPAIVAIAADTKTSAPPLAEIVATPAKPSGVYAVGEKASWTLSLKGQAADVKEIKYTLKAGGFTVIKEGKLELTDGKATLEAPMDAPNTLLVELKATVGGKEIKTLVGAVAAPDKIGVSAPRPEDFDAFWNAKIEELAKIPANPKIEPGESDKPNVEYAKVTLDNINGTHVYGQLAKPKKAGKYPAMLIVQYAGVYGLPKNNVIRRADNGWLALNIMAHDLPLDHPEDFYKKQSAGPLKDYMSIGSDDRDKSYFLRMYLGCYRAVDYLASRDDWDGKTLIVNGTSQGGQQTIVTAGLHPRITAMLANVPAGCDVTANVAGRAFGFPYFGNQAKWKKNPKIVEVGRYFDAVNFAYHIKCPAMVSMGLIDETCPPAGVLAAANQMTGPKEILILPLSNHQGTNNAQAMFWSRSEAWMSALAKGKDAPVK